MWKVAAISLMLLAALGCASPRGNVLWSERGRPAPNLVLGPYADTTGLAELHAQRSAWPSTPAGYIFDDVSTYNVVIYDDQSYYSPTWYGGGFTHESISVRSAVLVR